jgi:hypothetical protein
MAVDHDEVMSDSDSLRLVIKRKVDISSIMIFVSPINTLEHNRIQVSKLFRKIRTIAKLIIW